MSVLYPASARDAGQTLPFATFAAFEVFGEGTREVSKASVIAFTPLLKTEAELFAWNAYSAGHSAWIAQGRAFESTLGDIQNATDQTKQTRSWSVTNEEEQGFHNESEHGKHGGFTEYVYHFDSTGRAVAQAGDGPFTPLWQMSPVLADLTMVNFNLASNPVFAELLEYASLTGLPILSAPINPQDFFGASASENGTPHSILVQPIYNGFAHEKEHEIVGTVTALLSWEDFFEDVSGKCVCCMWRRCISKSLAG
jgi:hypothetical protein